MPHPLVPPVLDWFDATARDLPWREATCTPWGVLVSEVMLQQTPVARVEPLWRAWMQRWPAPGDLAAAPTADVLRAWDRLGYPRRALRLQQCAQAVVDLHDGVLPEAEDALLALPGVGTYTAAAVRAFAHGRRSVVVDTNVRRVLSRAVDGEALPEPSLTRAEMARAATLVPDDDATASRWNAAVMELGALVCTARSPRCPACPVQTLCSWRSAGYPVDAHAGRRRRQPFAGTDRQARGRVMASLRAADGAVPEDALQDVSTDPAQRVRALAGLVADGLVVVEPRTGPHPDEPGLVVTTATYRLP